MEWLVLTVRGEYNIKVLSNGSLYVEGGGS